MDNFLENTTNQIYKKTNSPMSLKYILCAIKIFPKIELWMQMALSVNYFKHLRKK